MEQLYEQYLVDAGLTPEQGRIYETLLKQGSIQAGRVARIAGYKRPLVYKILEQLIEMGLAEKDEKDGKVARFLPKHPARLKELIDQKIQKLGAVESSIDGIMGDMVSHFNLISGKPNVQFFEGEKGVWAVLEDTLKSKGEILQYADFDTVNTYIPEINKQYAQKRAKLDIQKRVIVPDNDSNRAGFHEYLRSATDFKLMPVDTGVKFETLTYIYEGKVSYITLRRDQMVGVIVTSKEIYTSQKAVFDHLWKTLTHLDIN